MKISTAEYFITESLHSIKRNGLMSVASLMTVALSLLILGIFTVMVIIILKVKTNLLIVGKM